MDKMDDLHPKLAENPPGSVKDRQPPPDDPTEDGLDKIAGFDKLVEKAADDFRPVAERFMAVHQDHEGDLATFLRKAGREAAEDGSFFATVNRAVVEARSWFETVDASVMDRVKEGEKHVLEAYEAAKDAGQSIEANAMLTRHIADIDRLLRDHAA